jgi:signal transduction histidine kinase
LKQGAELIGKGELGYKLNIKSKDELGNLAHTFNKMSSDLKVYTDKLKSTADENIAKEREIQDNLRLYAQMVSQAQEAERKRVARELHDETAQALVVVLRHLDDLASGKTNLSLSDIREEVRQVLEGVRHFSQELRPSILDDLGLIPAIKWLAADLYQNYGIKVETAVEGDPHQLPGETELSLFRITQEALTNIRKHSQATEVNIKVDFTDHHVSLTIQDNGIGFEKPSKLNGLAVNGKLGLAGMDERVQLLGGRLDIDTRQGKGTTINVEVPV